MRLARRRESIGVVATSIVTDVSNLATAVGAVLIVWQISLARREMRAAFERGFVDRYEAIIGRIPLPLILGDVVEDQSPPVTRAFFDYFELCEEEIYYRLTRRVGTPTWCDWWEGIALHLQRPAFRLAWEALATRAIVDAEGTQVRREQFTLLRRAVTALDAGRPFDPRRSWLQARR